MLFLLHYTMPGFPADKGILGIGKKVGYSFWIVKVAQISWKSHHFSNSAYIRLGLNKIIFEQFGVSTFWGGVGRIDGNRWKEPGNYLCPNVWEGEWFMCLLCECAHTHTNLTVQVTGQVDFIDSFPGCYRNKDHMQ